MDQSIKLLIKILSKYERLPPTIMSVNFSGNKISSVKKKFKIDVVESNLENVEHYDYIMISIVDMEISLDSVIKLIGNYKKNFILEVRTDFQFYKFIKKIKVDQVDIYDTRNVNLGYYYIVVNKK